MKSSVRRPVSRVLSCPLRGMDGHSSGARITAGFARPTRAEGRKCPCASTLQRRAVRPYSALLRVGFTLPPPLLGARCALTAPFHPYRGVSPRRGGLFSVALSLRSPPPAINRHPIPVEPGLSSSPRSLTNQRPPSRLTLRASGAMGVGWSRGSADGGGGCDAGAVKTTPLAAAPQKTD